MTDDIAETRRRFFGALVGAVAAFVIPTAFVFGVAALPPALGPDGLTHDAHIRAAGILVMLSPVAGLVVFFYFTALGLIGVASLKKSMLLSVSIGIFAAVGFVWSIGESAPLGSLLTIGAVILMLVGGSLSAGTLAWHWFLRTLQNREMTAVRSGADAPR